MKTGEAKRFNELYQRHLELLKLQGKSRKTINAYSRAVRRVSEYFDCCPDQLTRKQLETYFGKLVDSHSWSTVKIDRNGLQFFRRHVLQRVVRLEKIQSWKTPFLPTFAKKISPYI